MQVVRPDSWACTAWTEDRFHDFILKSAKLPASVCTHTLPMCLQGRFPTMQACITADNKIVTAMLMPFMTQSSTYSSEPCSILQLQAHALEPPGQKMNGEACSSCITAQKP